MTVYSVNLGIGWASSGVEYAQAYRGKVFRNSKIDSKFIFSDCILQDNIEALTKNIGFADDQIIWFYQFFTDVKIAPSTYPLAKFEADEQIDQRNFTKKVADDHKTVQYVSQEEGLVINVRFSNPEQQTIDQANYFANGQLVRRSAYSYVKYATEFYSGDGQQNHVSYREFYNEDGSKAYTQYVKGNREMFQFPNKLYYSKNELYEEFIKRLNFQKGDILIIDRQDDGGVLINGQLLFEHHGPAKLIIVVHADHYDKHFTNNRNVLWNNFYEYQFTYSDDVDCFIVSTDQQREMLQKQLKRYEDSTTKVVTIPVGSLKQLTKPTAPRKPHSLITASRLAPEKHVDWLAKAVVKAHEQVPDVSLDIYGQGGDQKRIQDVIDFNHAGDYIHLMGQQNLDQIYVKYSAYIAASTSEGFGLSLMEAVGSGLPMIGFDVPYGNPTFIDDQQNGYLIPYDEKASEDAKVDQLAAAIVKMFTEADLDAYSQHSYDLATPYLDDNITHEWQNLVEKMSND
ncbi:accessory Sec system glycosyltransferase GtfA [uncultured Limosilactobacillus sp.]|uniref:accessory Sec system glycosyltransferase GtfA n=1 Tax=uncultured Limosilactobacillus sp. TaxID=2837629 RepID=UPI0025DDC489|nr:accessory Sec system glycosyltransferase GtfA [uncultured Limosilactobacillus sp.]